jgi:hypothetical protein
MRMMGMGVKNLVSTSGAAIDMNTPGGVPNITLTVMKLIAAIMLFANKMIPEIARRFLPILPCRNNITAPTNMKSRSGTIRAKVFDNETLGENSIKGSRKVFTITPLGKNNHPDIFPITSKYQSEKVKVHVSEEIENVR